MTEENKQRFFAPCPRGLEAVLAGELAELGAGEIAAADGAGGGWRTGWGGYCRSGRRSGFLRDAAGRLCRQSAQPHREPCSVASRIGSLSQRGRCLSRGECARLAAVVRWHAADTRERRRGTQSAQQPGLHHFADQGCRLRQVPLADRRSPERGYLA